MSATTQRAPRRSSRGLAVFGYALLSFASLAVALLVGWWIFTQAELLGVRFDKAYYILLCVLAVSIALFLFGVVRSVAALSGQHFGLAWELGGPAALAGLVVLGGFWLTAPPPTFQLLLRLQYQGSEAAYAAFDDALSTAKLRVTIGDRYEDYDVGRNGEVAVRDISAHFRNGTFGVELRSDRMRLVDPQPGARIPFPPNGSVVWLKVTMLEPPERRAARERARERVMQVMVSIQKTLMRDDWELFPAIDAYLANPSDTAWQRVLDTAERTLKDVEEGIELALEYDSSTGGLLSQAQRTSAAVHDARDRILSYRLENPRQLEQSRPSLAGFFGEATRLWGSRRAVLREPPRNPQLQAEVIAWRERLLEAYRRLYKELEILAEQLQPPA